MSQNEVTRRFLFCLEQLHKNKKIKSNRQFAQSVDYLPQSLSEIAHGRRDVPVDVLSKAVEVWHFNTEYLLKGIGHFFNDEQSSDLQILTVVTNDRGQERILHVPHAAQAGYLNEMLDPVFLRNLPTFSLPGYQYDTQSYRCFDIHGDSMEPTLFDGDKLVCSYTEPGHWFAGIRNMHVYVVATRGDLLVKRVQVLPKEQRGVMLISDNTFYPPQYVPFSEIRELWYVKTKISPFLHAPPRQQEMEEMQEQLYKMQEILTKLNNDKHSN